MTRALQRILAGLAIGGVAAACSDRPLADEEPPPDIEGLCRAHCARVMECVWTPDIGATFDTEEGCRHNCAADVLWDECPRELEAQRICTTQYDCPEFADPRFVIDGCREEGDAVHGCNE